MWIEHHRVFRLIKAYDNGLLVRNLLMLLTVSFIPFPTALFSEYPWSQRGLHPLRREFRSRGAGETLGLALCGAGSPSSLVPLLTL